MLISALLLILFTLIGVFLINRLIVALRHGELNVRGALYSRESTPLQFWTTILFASLGVLFSISMALAGASTFLTR